MHAYCCILNICMCLFAFRFRKYRINLRFADFLLMCDARPDPYICMYLPFLPSLPSNWPNGHNSRLTLLGLRSLKNIAVILVGCTRNRFTFKKIHQLWNIYIYRILFIFFLFPVFCLLSWVGFFFNNFSTCCTFFFEFSKLNPISRSDEIDSLGFHRFLFWFCQFFLFI